jgi:hypothetical protein
MPGHDAWRQTKAGAPTLRPLTHPPGESIHADDSTAIVEAAAEEPVDREAQVEQPTRQGASTIPESTRTPVRGPLVGRAGRVKPLQRQAGNARPGQPSRLGAEQTDRDADGKHCALLPLMGAERLRTRPTLRPAGTRASTSTSRQHRDPTKPSHARVRTEVAASSPSPSSASGAEE